MNPTTSPVTRTTDASLLSRARLWDAVSGLLEDSEAQLPAQHRENLLQAVSQCQDADALLPDLADGLTEDERNVLIEKARQMHAEDDSISIDGNARLSDVDGLDVWVQAWVLVRTDSD